MVLISICRHTRVPLCTVFGMGVLSLGLFNCSDSSAPVVESCVSTPIAPTSLTLYDIATSSEPVVLENGAALTTVRGGQGSLMFTLQVGLGGLSSGSCADVSIDMSQATRAGWDGSVRADFNNGELRTRPIFIPYRLIPPTGAPVHLTLTAHGLQREYDLFYGALPMDAAVPSVADASVSDAPMPEASVDDAAMNQRD